MLTQIRDQVTTLRDLAGQTEIKIGEIVGSGIGGGCAAAFRSGRFAESAGESVLSVERVDIENLCANGQKFVTELDRVAPADDRVIELRIE